MGPMTPGQWLLERDNEFRAAARQSLLDDPIREALRRMAAMIAAPNPFLPQHDPLRVQWFDSEWEPVCDSHPPSEVRPTFNATDWDAWWSRYRGPQFPLSWTVAARRRRWREWFMACLIAEQRAALVTAATGRIMNPDRQETNRGVWRVRGQQERPVPGAFRRRDRAALRHRR